MRHRPYFDVEPADVRRQLVGSFRYNTHVNDRVVNEVLNNAIDPGLQFLLL